MAPKNKFTKEEMTEAALRVVRQQGLDGLTALLRAAGYEQLPGTGSRLQLWKRP